MWGGFRASTVKKSDYYGFLWVSHSSKYNYFWHYQITVKYLSNSWTGNGGNDKVSQVELDSDTLALIFSGNKIIPEMGHSYSGKEAIEDTRGNFVGYEKSSSESCNTVYEIEL